MSGVALSVTGVGGGELSVTCLLHAGLPARLPCTAAAAAAR